MIDGLQVSCMAAMPQMGMEPRQWLAALSGMGWSNGFLDDCGVIIYPSIQNIHIIINIYIYMIILWMVYIYSISMVYLWYIYGISCCTKKNTHMLKLELRWVCFAGVIIYLSISLGLSTRGLYANVNGENAHEQWHFGGCFTHFQTNSLEDMLCFTRVRGCFSTFSCGYGYGSTPIIPEGLFQRRFVYR